MSLFVVGVVVVIVCGGYGDRGVFADDDVVVLVIVKLLQLSNSFDVNAAIVVLFIFALSVQMQ